MKIITLLPADQYIVINKTILTEIDKKNLINLYEPIIGASAVSLYLTLWSDLDKLELMSIDYTHHHLMTLLKMDLNTIKLSREALEGVGLLKTYFKSGNINSYIYELYSPLSASEFFNHPIFNIVLYINIGKMEYEMLKKQYNKINVDLKEYEDITKRIDETFESVNSEINVDARERTIMPVSTINEVDFDLIIETLPKSIVNKRTFDKRNRELINNLAFIYDLDTLKIIEILRMVLNENGYLSKEELRKTARKYYQFNNGGLPTLLYRSQPEYLKSPVGDNTKRGKIIGVFENTTPYDFLKNKYKGSNPTSRDLKLLESLLIDLELKPAVVNVLIDYVLRKNDNKLTTSFVETIAGQWKRAGIETARDAMDIAAKEHKKYNKQIASKTNIKKIEEPVWFNKEIEKEEITDEEKEELAELLKEFR
ncbi:MAG: DnaD domain protein [Bacilli bacterium]|nr:DnaD domain protein [Bacilli bacterium]